MSAPPMPGNDLDEFIESLWMHFDEEIRVIVPGKVNWKQQSLPLARIKKIMKSDEVVFTDMEREATTADIAAMNAHRFMIAGEAPILLSKACEMMVKEITARAWRHTEKNRRRTLQKQDVFAAVGESEVFDFLIDIVPRVHCPPKTFVPPQDDVMQATVAQQQQQQQQAAPGDQQPLFLQYNMMLQQQQQQQQQQLQVGAAQSPSALIQNQDTALSPAMAMNQQMQQTQQTINQAQAQQMMMYAPQLQQQQQQQQQIQQQQQQQTLSQVQVQQQQRLEEQGRPQEHQEG